MTYEEACTEANDLNLQSIAHKYGYIYVADEVLDTDDLKRGKPRPSGRRVVMR